MALALHRRIIRNLSVSSVRYFYNRSFLICMFDALTSFCMRLPRFTRNDNQGDYALPAMTQSRQPCSNNNIGSPIALVVVLSRQLF